MPFFNIRTVKDVKSDVTRKGEAAFVPRGNSMWPFLKNGGQTVIIGVPKRPFSVYDVIFFTRADGTEVLHRIIGFDGNDLLVCGDSQFTVERVSPQAVFAVMNGFYKGKRYVECSDEKYLKDVEKWYKRKIIRKIRLKFFYLGLKIKRIFKR